MSYTRIERLEDLPAMYEAERKLTCGLCTEYERERGQEVLKLLSEWWLSDELVEILGTHQIIRFSDKAPAKQNMGINYYINVNTDEKPWPIFLYQIQHEWAEGRRKPGLHYQFQLPHCDFLKQCENVEMRAKVNRYLISNLDPQVDPYRHDGKESIHPAKVVVNIDLFKSVIVGTCSYIRDL